ncbi:MAG: hypothetical protein LBQ31_04995 [Bacteroidales bacterium]|jgi:glycosidase|nr:hypothetical protein [Bacteroidales bacterium]
MRNFIFSTTVGIVLLCLSFSCSNLSVEKTKFDKIALSGFLSLDRDTTSIFLFDYFPEISVIDSITFSSACQSGTVVSSQNLTADETVQTVVSSQNLTADEAVQTVVSSQNLTADEAVQIVVSSQNLTADEAVQIVVSSQNASRLYVMNVWSNGEKGSVVMINRTAPSYDSGEPVIVTNSFASDKFSIRCVKNGVESFVVLWQNTVLDSNFYTLSDSSLTVTIPANAYKRERSYIRVIASNECGVSNDLLIPLSYGKVISQTSMLNRNDKQGMIMYFLMVDRFNNGSQDNDMLVADTMVLPKVNYYGGDLRGVIEKIESGFFDSLGVNTVWLSPISQNPFDAWGLFPEPKTAFSGYHGYWPVNNTQVDVRFGSDKVFRELIDKAHGRGMNVILDYVANHLHINSPTLQQHPDWKTPDTTPDGRPNFELWDEFRLTTWFDRHIPTLDLERADVYEPMTDTALYWIEHYALDGYRHDATKHIPEVYWRTLIKKIKARYPNRNVYQIGETYGSPELINSYVKTGMLDAQFDFNLYDAIMWTLADSWSGWASMDRIVKTINESLNIYGYHNVMGLVSGNQDRPRFISLAGGDLKPDEDSKRAGWMRDIGVGDSIFSYSRLKMLQAFMMTLPGIPCIYYGDEYGMPGANDPDNRRMMKFDGYSPMQQDVLNNMRTLIHLRKNSMPLIYGDLVQLFSDKNVLVYERVYMGEYIVVAFNMGDERRDVTVKEAVTGKEISVEVAANSYSIIR